jgi:tetratricopeptide (TPR) repeat protein
MSKLKNSPRPSVFISYRWEANLKEETRRLAAWLRDQGIEVISDHSYPAAPEKGWPTWMLHSIEKVETVLIICSEGYKKCFEKRGKGKGKGATWEGAIITMDLYESYGINNKYYPILLRAGEYQHVPKVLKAWCDGIALSEHDRILKLILREEDSSSFASEARGNKDENPYRGELPFNNLPERQNAHFTGRKDTLEKIHQTFQQGEIAALSQAIAGLGGVGKTEIALEYAYRHQGDYDYIWWVDAEKESGVVQAYRKFALEKSLIDKDTETEEVFIKAVRRWMQTTESWLFIFDNVELQGEAQSFEWLKKYLPQSQRNGQHILMTSRNALWGRMAKTIDIGVFSAEEAGEFLTEVTGLPEDAAGSRERLAKTLDHLPLALAHAASYICDRKQGYADYLVLFEDYRLRIFDKETSDLPMTPKRNVHTTWAISIDHLSRKSASARQLLNLAAFLAPDGIRMRWFEQGAKFLPSPLQEDIQNKLERNDLLPNLRKYSLITEGENGFGVHRLLQEVIRESLDAEQGQWVDYCVSLLHACRDFDFSTPEKRAEFLALAPHIEAVTNREGVTERKEIADLYVFLGRGYGELAQYSKEMERYLKALAVSRKVLGEEHLDMSTIYSNIGGVYHNWGNYENALEWYFKALAIREEVLGKEHPDTATIYHNIAEGYRCQYEYKKALEWNSKALAINEKVLGKEHRSTIITYNNIALVFSDVQDYEEALAWYLTGLAISEKVLGKDHPDTAMIYHNIAGVYTSQGDYEKALEWYLKDLAISEKVLGKEHPNMATAYHNIAMVYKSQGKYAKALSEFLKAYRIIVRTFGEAHPHAKTFRNNMEIAYQETANPKPFSEWLAEAMRCPMPDDPHVP